MNNNERLWLLKNHKVLTFNIGQHATLNSYLNCLCVEFFTDSQLPVKLDKLMDERQQLLRMNDIIKQLWLIEWPPAIQLLRRAELLPSDM